MVLLRVQEHDAALTPIPFSFHHTIVERAHGDIQFFEGAEGEHRTRIDVNAATATASLSGDPINLDGYIREWMDTLKDEIVNSFPSSDIPDGVYEREGHSRRKFAPGEFVVNDSAFACADLRLTVAIRVQRAVVESHFEVESRGRSIRFAPVKLGEGEVQVGFVLR